MRGFTSMIFAGFSLGINVFHGDSVVEAATA
jgi:hypothetical protein